MVKDMYLYTMKNNVMKKTSISIIVTLAVIALIAVVSCSGKKKQSAEPIVIDTTELCKDVIGHHATTPVVITIVDGKIQSVVALPSDETPSYYEDAVKVLDSFKGLTVKQALKADVDAISGATMSSVALIKNVKAGLETLK